MFRGHSGLTPVTLPPMSPVVTLTSDRVVPVFQWHYDHSHHLRVPLDEPLTAVDVKAGYMCLDWLVRKFLSEWMFFVGAKAQAWGLLELPPITNPDSAAIAKSYNQSLKKVESHRELLWPIFELAYPASAAALEALDPVDLVGWDIHGDIVTSGGAECWEWNGRERPSHDPSISTIYETVRFSREILKLKLEEL